MSDFSDFVWQRYRMICAGIEYEMAKGGDYPGLDRSVSKPLRWLRQGGAALILVFIVWVGIDFPSAFACASGRGIPGESHIATESGLSESPITIPITDRSHIIQLSISPSDVSGFVRRQRAAGSLPQIVRGAVQNISEKSDENGAKGYDIIMAGVVPSVSNKPEDRFMHGGAGIIAGIIFGICFLAYQYAKGRL